MKKTLIIFTSITALAGTSTAEDITNGSFEINDFSAGDYASDTELEGRSQIDIGASATGWTISNGAGILEKSGKGGTTDGNYAARIDTVGWVVAQVISLASGNSILSFNTWAEIQSGVEPNFRVSLSNDSGAVFIRDFQELNSDGVTSRSEGITIDTAGDYTLKFEGLSSTPAPRSYPDMGLAIDNVTLTSTPVPEPSGTVLLGLGILGILVHRSRSI